MVKKKKKRKRSRFCYHVCAAVGSGAVCCFDVRARYAVRRTMKFPLPTEEAKRKKGTFRRKLLRNSKVWRKPQAHPSSHYREKNQGDS